MGASGGQFVEARFAVDSPMTLVVVSARIGVGVSWGQLAEVLFAVDPQNDCTDAPENATFLVPPGASLSKHSSQWSFLMTLLASLKKSVFEFIRGHPVETRVCNGPLE